LAVLPAFAESFEIVVVDDGSRDRTGEIADRLAVRDGRIGSSTMRGTEDMAAR
jgi:glycosyltransferase involved in cell wall biosynthesis